MLDIISTELLEAVTGGATPAPGGLVNIHTPLKPTVPVYGIRPGDARLGPTGRDFLRPRHDFNKPYPFR